MLRSPVYNLFSRSNHRLVLEIIGCGHYIGLYFDRNIDRQLDVANDNSIDFESSMLEGLFGVQVNAISFYQKDSAVIGEQVSIGKRIKTQLKE